MLLTGALTATIAFIGVALTNRSNNRRLQQQLEHEANEKERDLRLERIEELYVLTERFKVRFQCTMLPIVKVMEGMIDYNQALDIQLRGGDKEPPNFERIQAIVDIHFPEPAPGLEALLAARDEANRIEADYRIQYKMGYGSGEGFLPAMRAALDRLDDRSTALQSKIAQLGRHM